MAGVLIGVDRPPLAAALTVRGVPLWQNGVPDAVVTTAEHWRDIVPGARALVLTRDEAEAAAAIDAGADDAMPLATADALIAARVAAWHRRPDRVTVGDLVIGLSDRRVTRGGRDLPLLPREYALLLHLARHAGKVVGRGDLLREIWGLRFDPGTNVVQVHVSRLRARLDRGFDRPMLITVKRIGYCLVAAPG